MTFDDFFNYFDAHPWEGFGTPSLDIERVPRGWKVRCLGGVSWGYTVEDAIQAAFDHALRRPSRHAAVQQPFTKGSPFAVPTNYYYRTVDWQHGDPRE